jgi:antitoxin (DNA-binding transcriptional repressor) of toxin-antitoxin stability system
MQVNIHEAKTRFSVLVERALAGERVVIARNGTALLSLEPIKERSKLHTPGLTAGKGTIPEDFDAELDEEQLMENGATAAATQGSFRSSARRASPCRKLCHSDQRSPDLRVPGLEYMEAAMLCKLTPKNQITLPKEVLQGFQGKEYFNAQVDQDRIILEPMIVRPGETSRLASIRDAVADSGIMEEDVQNLVDEARHESRP